MNYRLLSWDEKLFALKRLRELGRLDHLIPRGVDMIAVHRQMAKKNIVGAFDEDGIAFIYWTYRSDAEAKRRYIAVGALRQLDREMIRHMKHCVRHVTREWELWGEIDADNPRGVKLAELFDFRVEAVLDSRIVVKHPAG